jgi:YbbR domain-containing protein
VSALPQALTRNWTLKLASFGLAVFLWAVEKAEPVQQEVLSAVPVQVQVADLEWTLAGDPDPPEVQVRFAGPEREIQRLSRENAFVRVALETVVGPDTVVELRRDWVSVVGTPNLRVLELVPEDVHLTFERTAQATVPLSVRARGRLPRGVALAAPVGVSPAVVRVRGPARVVNALDSIALVPLDLSQVAVSGLVDVMVDTTGLSELTLTPTQAQLAFRIEAAAERLLPGVPVEIEGPAAAVLRVEPPALPVTVRGARSKLDAATLDSVRVLVPAQAVQDVEPGESRRVPVRVVGLPPLLNADVAVDSVTVRRPRPSEGLPADTTRGGT